LKTVSVADLVRSDQTAIFRLAAFPPPQKQGGRSMNVVDNVGRVGALHEKIDFPLAEKLGKVRYGGGDHDDALIIGLSEESARYVANEVTKMSFDFFLIHRGYEAERD